MLTLNALKLKDIVIIRIIDTDALIVALHHFIAIVGEKPEKNLLMLLHAQVTDFHTRTREEII